MNPFDAPGKENPSAQANEQPGSSRKLETTSGADNHAISASGSGGAIGTTKQEFIPPPATQVTGSASFTARIPLTDRKRFLLGQLFDRSGELLRDYMPYDHNWPQRMIKGSGNM